MIKILNAISVSVSSLIMFIIQGVSKKRQPLNIQKNHIVIKHNRLFLGTIELVIMVKHAVVTLEYEQTLFWIDRGLKSIVLENKVNILEY